MNTKKNMQNQKRTVLNFGNNFILATGITVLAFTIIPLFPIVIAFLVGVYITDQIKSKKGDKYE